MDSHSLLDLLALLFAKVLVLGFVTFGLVLELLEVVGGVLLDELEVRPRRVLEPDVSISHVRLTEDLLVVGVRVLHAGTGASLDREDMLRFEFVVLLRYRLHHDFLDLSGFCPSCLQLFFSGKIVVLRSCFSLDLLLFLGFVLLRSVGALPVLIFPSLVFLVVGKLLFVQQDGLRVLVQLDEWRVQHLLLQQHQLSVRLDLKDHVLWLEIRMNDITDAMKVVESHQALSGDLSHDWHGYTLISEALDEGQEVAAEHLEGHDRVASVHAMMEELIEHLEVVRVRPRNLKHLVLFVLADRIDPCLGLIVAGDIEQDFFLLQSALRVLVCTLLDLQSVKLFVLELQGEPNGGKVAPAELFKDDVLVVENFTSRKNKQK